VMLDRESADLYNLRMRGLRMSRPDGLQGDPGDRDRAGSAHRSSGTARERCISWLSVCAATKAGLLPRPAAAPVSGELTLCSAASRGRYRCCAGGQRAAATACAWTGARSTLLALLVMLCWRCLLAALPVFLGNDDGGSLLAFWLFARSERLEQAWPAPVSA